MAIFAEVEDIVVVGVAEDGAGAVTRAARHGADVVLMDLWMPGTGGVEATRALRASQPRTGVVVLTTYEDDALIAAALGAGASGFSTKEAST